MFEIFINNKKFFFEKNFTVLQACEQANIQIPRFCYHEKLSVAGNCRMCLVEIEKSPKPVASCAMPLSNGMVIFTETPLVKKAREAVLEFLLINHPLDCPICDQGGECDLQDITLNYGADRNRFFEIKRGVEDKECGPIIKTIMTRCIHCTRCVRFLTELAGLEIFGALGRGELTEIGTFLNRHLKTELSGNLIDLCPVGALTSKPYAFLARNWELKKVETVDFSDALGSNVIIHTRNNSKNFFLKGNFSLPKEHILRILPKLNNDLNENWISDKSRFAFDGIFFNRHFCIEEFDDLTNKNFSYKSWSFDLLTKIYFNLKNCTNLLGLVGENCSVEELFFFYQFLKNLGNSAILFNRNVHNFNIDLPVFYQFNNTFADLEKSDFIFLIGTFPRFEGSVLNMRIRKHFFNKEVCVGYIGEYNNFTYPITHLGISTKTLLQIVEGTHLFCKKLRTFKNPLIIYGSSLGFRVDGKILQNLIKFLSKKLFLNLQNSINLNCLHSNFMQTHFCELGVVLNAKNFLYKLSLDKNFLERHTHFLLTHGNTNINAASGNVICALNTHLNSNSSFKSKFTLPINTSTERDSLCINTQGFVQKAFKSTSSSKLSRNSEDFFKTLIKLHGKPADLVNFMSKTLQKELPFLQNLNKMRIKFKFNFFKIQALPQKIYFSTLTQSISNFYMTDVICNNSKTMSECSLHLKTKTNYF